MGKRPKISVIIVNYNGGRWLNNSIESVANQTYSGFECIIIDNGSTDNSLEKIPTTGEMLVWKTFTFEIVDMDQHRIDKILVTLTEED